MYSKNELESVIKICDILFGNHHEIKRIQETLKMDIRRFKKIRARYSGYNPWKGW